MTQTEFLEDQGILLRYRGKELVGVTIFGGTETRQERQKEGKSRMKGGREFRVTNEPPLQADLLGDVVHREMLDIFRTYTGLYARPYVHQVEVWRQIVTNQSAFVIAGTASGKTLAAAVPLFHKLFRAQESQRIRRALWMYPTIALLEDQRRVLTDLSKAMGLDSEAVVGELYGGMPRSRLISALNKPVILATPDEIYWFFRKNVKYNSLLIYGLALVDEFVLDEAHLFNGLMLRNFEHLWHRIETLAGYLGKTPRLHVLTATPEEGLKRLHAAKPITGKSKCADVSVEVRASGRFDRTQQFVDAVDEALQVGQQKVLLVCNSARMAHQLFEKCKVEETSTIPIEHRLRFGKIELGNLIEWLEKGGIEKELLTELSERMFRDEDVVLADVLTTRPCLCHWRKFSYMRRKSWSGSAGRSNEQSGNSLNVEVRRGNRYSTIALFPAALSLPSVNDWSARQIQRSSKPLWING